MSWFARPTAVLIEWSFNSNMGGMSPRSAAANQSLRDAARARLITHALRLFGERGYASTPVSAIAASAGVSHGLLYHYFPGKTELVVAIFEDTLRDVRESWARADAEPNPRLRLTALLRAVGVLIRERRDFWALSYGVRMQREVLASLGPLLEPWIREIHERLRRYLGAAGWSNAGLEARLLFAQIDGLSQHYVLDPAHYPLDAAIERLIQRYRHPPPTGRSSTPAAGSRRKRS
jgi:AcrR family transcriptional regulator